MQGQELLQTMENAIGHQRADNPQGATYLTDPDPDSATISHTVPPETSQPTIDASWLPQTIDSLSESNLVQINTVTPHALPLTFRRESMHMPSSEARAGSPLPAASSNHLRTASNGKNDRSPSSLSGPWIGRKSSSSSLTSATSTPSLPSPRRPPSSMDLARAPSTLSSYSTALPAQFEEPPLTAVSVASDFFARDLLSHDNLEATAETVVIIHDACYGHRFSRPKTTKTSLSLIVERPERILACALGVSAAYVRLGSRHKGGLHAPHPDKTPHSELPFKICKSSRSVDLTSPAVVSVHGKKWMEELKLMCESAGTKLALGMKELERPEASTPSQAERPEFHEGDLYLCAESLNALQAAAGGVCDAVDQVFSTESNAPRRAFVAIRPPGHHCSSDWPSGFCWINNVHIAIEYAAQNYGLTHAAILDFDLHHGDGSQEVTWDRNTKSAGMPKNAPFSKKTAIGYYSLHDINSYPCEWGDKEKVQNASLCIDNAHGQSIWNIHLEPWTTMDEFWALYETKYTVLLDKARAFLKRHTQRIKATPKQVPAKAAIFISAGFDASEWESGGMQRHAVNVPTEFYARFTRDVVRISHEEGTAVDGRVISVLEGGYSDRALTSGVLSHLSGLCPSQASPDANDIAAAIQKMDIAATSPAKTSPSSADGKEVLGYNVDWWHSNNLTALDHYITPPPPPPVPKRTGRVPTYATPTQSFTQKVVDPENFKRSISSTLRAIPTSAPKRVPPPEVDWIVATHELSKLLIPSDRQTKSCMPEELAPVRVKKERLSGPAAIPVDTGRQLRERKTKTPDPSNHPPDMDAITDSLRRQTISDLPISTEVASSLPPRSGTSMSTRRSSQIHSTAESKRNSGHLPPVPAIPSTAISRPATAEPIPPKIRKARAPATKFAPAPAPVKVESKARPTGSPAKAKGVSSPLTSGASSASDSQTSDRQSGAGPKRILLKLGTREQSERKTKERLEAEYKGQPDKTKPKPKRVDADQSKLRTSMAQQRQPSPKPTTQEQQNSIPEVEVSIATPDMESSAASDDFSQQEASGEQLQDQQGLQAVVNRIDTLVPKVYRSLSAGSSDAVGEASSPPMFTPTSMSQFQSPVVTPGESGVNYGSSFERDMQQGQQQESDLEITPKQTRTIQREDLDPMPHGDAYFRKVEMQKMMYQNGHGQGQGQGKALPVFSSTGTIPFAQRLSDVGLVASGQEDRVEGGHARTGASEVGGGHINSDSAMTDRDEMDMEP